MIEFASDHLMRCDVFTMITHNYGLIISSVLSFEFSLFLIQSESTRSKVSDCFSYDLHALHVYV